MKIILIRHGTPDYELDALTEKGVREAKLLAERVTKWENITQFYCSPLGRAKQTASYSLEKTGREAITYDWMREFSYFIDDPVTGRHGVPWDFMPSYWTKIPEMYDKNAWQTTDIYLSNETILPAYREVCEGLDKLLSSYGYERHENYYVTTSACKKPEGAPEDIIVIFCHLGVTCMMLSHLLGISPVPLLHNFFLATTSVTVLGTEERMADDAIFRVQMMGDTSHLLQGGEPVSKAGYFTEPFQG